MGILQQDLISLKKKKQTNKKRKKKENGGEIYRLNEN